MFLYLIIITLSFLILAYCLKIFRAPFFTLAEDSVALVNTLLLKIEEDEKVAMVQKQNTKLIIALFKVFASILFAIVIASIPVVVYSLIHHKGYEDLDFASFESIIALSVGSTLGFLIPLKRKTTEGYSELSQLLHRLALNNYAIAYKLFKLESKKLSKSGVGTKTKFVIVSGLARAGTTSLMNRLLENKMFASLDYSNMPFLTSPNLWKKFYNPKGGKKKERSHKDGILIGLDSNEALEEYFFKVLANDSYIKQDTLEEYKISEDNYLDYLKYQAVIRKTNQSIYLAKNNNLLIRYNSLRKLNSDFIAVFLYRDPLSHASSLLEKHKEYSKLQKEDSFVLEYMDWLGHHEFGLNQKPFNFKQKEIRIKSDKNTLDYWLQIWINYYQQLLTIDRANCIFISYEDYCKSPIDALNMVSRKLEIEPCITGSNSFNITRKTDLHHSKELEIEAYKIFNKLLKVKVQN